MRHSETCVAFVRRRHFRCWGGPWVTEFHWGGSASKRGLWVGTCIFGFSWVGTPVFSHFQCRQARPEGFFGRPVGRRRTEHLSKPGFYVRLRPQVPTPTFQKMPRARPSGPRVSVILKKGRQPGRHARFLGSELGRQNDVSGSAKSQGVHDLQ